MNCKNFYSFQELEAGLLKLLEENSYRPEPLAYFRKKLEALRLYMAGHGIDRYSPEVGERFFDDHVRENSYGVSARKSLHTVMRRMNDYYLGNGFVRMPAKAEMPLPGDYDRVLKLFADACIEKGNRASTIKNKLYFCRTFYESLDCLGCGSVKEMNSEQISRACVMIRNKDGWAVIRELLRFLAKTGEIEKDFSLLVPSYGRGFRLPATYSEEDAEQKKLLIRLPLWERGIMVSSCLLRVSGCVQVTLWGFPWKTWTSKKKKSLSSSRKPENPFLFQCPNRSGRLYRIISIMDGPHMTGRPSFCGIKLLLYRFLPVR